MEIKKSAEKYRPSGQNATGNQFAGINSRLVLPNSYKRKAANCDGTYEYHDRHETTEEMIVVNMRDEETETEFTITTDTDFSGVIQKDCAE